MKGRSPPFRFSALRRAVIAASGLRHRDACIRKHIRNSLSNRTPIMEWSEINAAIQEKVNAATEEKTGDEKDRATAEVLKGLDQPIRQFLYDGGHKAATAANSAKIRELESERETLTSERDSAKAKVDEMQAGVPNADEIKRQYQDAERQLKEQHEAELKRLKGEVVSMKTESFESKVFGKLGPRLSEDGTSWAETQLAKMRLDGRIRPGESGIEVLQPGKTIPYTAETEDELSDIVVKEIVSGAKPWALKSGADTGGGSNGSGAGGGTGSPVDSYIKAVNAAHNPQPVTS